MNLRQRVNAILHYEPYTGGMPVVSFGYWVETLDKWADQGHVSREDARGYAGQGDNSPADRRVMAKLGFDFNWNNCVGGNSYLFPSFETEVLEHCPDGSRIERNPEGLLVRVHDGIVSIPAEIGTSMTGREAWETMYLPRLLPDPARVNRERFDRIQQESAERTEPLGLHLGSLYGNIRNMLGVEGISYLALDDEDLYVEIIDTVGTLCYETVKSVLASGAGYDYGHFWEDICFKTGPLVSPAVFDELVGPHYKRITDLLLSHGIDIVSLDCDGKIDLLIPTWLQNGVNTMFPIEVGTWDASIAPWRAQYGKSLRGIGGMDKRVFARDRAAVDREIERLKPLVDLGGYIPCPDHRIPPDAEFGLVQYYCDRFRKAFS